jgi:hypothetical protein
MTAPSSRRLARGLARAAVPSAVVLALTAGLAGCKGVVVASSTPPASITAVAASAPAASSAAAAPSVAAADPATTAAASAPTTAPGPGSVSVSVTSPVTISGSVQVPVSCATGLAYRATVSTAVVQGDQLSFSVAIPRYRGAGSYDAVVGVTLHQASGVVTTVAGVSRVPAVISSTGGSFSVSATGSGGRTFTGALKWTCGS